MKHFTLLIALLPLLSFGQVTIQNNVLSTAGTSQTNGVIVLDYNLGEVFTTTISNGSRTLTQGFEQSYRYKVYVGQENVEANVSITDIELGTINIYPNPTMDVVFLEMNTDKGYIVDMTDMTGRKINSYELYGMKNQIDLRPYENGTYYLQIQMNQGRSVRLPIVKAN